MTPEEQRLLYVVKHLARAVGSLPLGDLHATLAGELVQVRNDPDQAGLATIRLKVVSDGIRFAELIGTLEEAEDRARYQRIGAQPEERGASMETTLLPEIAGQTQLLPRHEPD